MIIKKQNGKLTRVNGIVHGRLVSNHTDTRKCTRAYHKWGKYVGLDRWHEDTDDNKPHQIQYYL